MRIENRKRNIQVKFRLTPEEDAVLRDDVLGSGMTRNDYIIQTLIAKALIPMLFWEKRYMGNDLEISCKFGKQLAGFARCTYVNGLNQVEIHSLFVSDAYKKGDLMTKLLDEVHTFAKEMQGESIKVCCGIEPMSSDTQLPLEQEIAFYRKNGFVRKENTFANIPCMVKILNPDMKLCVG